ncbi:MAG: hypothetical protein ACYDHH_15890 [Solirubrobacteraceae bacterium]
MPVTTGFGSGGIVGGAGVVGVVVGVAEPPERLPLPKGEPADLPADLPLAEEPPDAVFLLLTADEGAAGEDEDPLVDPAAAPDEDDEPEPEPAAPDVLVVLVFGAAAGVLLAEPCFL